MKTVNTTSCVAHVLVCVNRREDGSSMPCCAGREGAGGEAVYELLRTWVQDQQLLTRIWITRTACLGWCHLDGATLVFYPEGRWYRAVTTADVPALIQRHLAPHA